MYRYALVTLAVIVLLLAACSPPAAPDGSTQPPATIVAPTSTPASVIESGVVGQIFIGPTCPVQREGDDSCADQPFQATITVLDAGGNEVTRIESDQEGHFGAFLAPGDYTLRPERPDPNLPLPVAGEIAITVVAGQFTEVTITYDSGIR